jgi:predicted esterase
MKFKASIFFLYCCFLAFNTLAQQTGSFNVSINFMGQQRTLAMYVPPAYNPIQAYRLLVGLHGFGGNGTAFRNDLTGPARNWQDLMPNTIFICPDGSADGDHYEPAGYEEIIQKSIDYAESHFHIDTDNIILEGFSFGGRSALKFGLDHYQEFKGLLLNTPAIQGVIDAIYGIPLNGSDFAYQNAPHLPIYITLGADDLPYVPPVDSAFELLAAQNGIVRYFIIPGMGHNIPPTGGPALQGFLPFLEHPGSPTEDAQLLKIKMRPRTCDATVQPKCWVRNLGNNILHTINLRYSWNGQTSFYTWTGTLAPFSQTDIQLPMLTAQSGIQTLSVTVDSVNNTVDLITGNNSQSATYEWMDAGHSLPLAEGFDQTGIFPPAGWQLQTIGDYYIGDWGESEDVKKSGAGAAFCFNTAMIFYNLGHSSNLLSPLLDLHSVNDPYLTFDVAYNYHRWGPPLYNYTVDVADTLMVSISTDCGESWQLLYKQGGTQLATFSNPIVNPQTVDAAMINPASGNWRTDSISLADFGNVPQALIRFSYKSARGGSIVIDNIKFSGSPTGIGTVPPQNQVTIWPNPAKNKIFIKANKEIREIKITDVSGSVLRDFPVIHLKTKQTISINTEGLTTGIYFIKLKTENGNLLTQKLAIK